VKNILQGNVLDRIKDIEEKSVQCVVTSPPYWNLRDYQTAEWEQGDEECDHIEKIPFSGNTGIRDHRKETTKKEVEGKSIQYKSKCKKCSAIRKDSQLGLEETPEEFIENMVKVFRGVKKSLKDNGTLWLNLGDSYNTTSSGNKTWGNGVGSNKNYEKKGIFPKKKNKAVGLKAKDLVGIPWRVALALQQDGWYLRQDIIWHKPNPMPESVKDRCTKAHEYIFLLSKSPKYYYDSDAIRDKPHYGEEVGANKRSVWSINVKAYKEAHFATFPEKLPELCIKAGSKKGDIVLDPFFGSGTTGWVAQRLGREWLGIELNPEFIKIAEKRFAQRELF
jgi:site-specific DNA-methyltransferase (cytosine-N4-specific)